MADTAIPSNIMHFARLLRGAGLRVGPAQVMDAVQACTLVDITQRADVHATLKSLFIHRQEESDLFEAAFDLFWRSTPETPPEELSSLLDQPKSEPAEKQALSNRLAESMGASTQPTPDDALEAEEQAGASYSARARLKQMDFASMTVDELADARRMIRKLHLPLSDRPTRRFRPAPFGERIDLRATLAQAVRSGAAPQLMFKRRRRRHPPLVALCDISGSMAGYSRMLLYFLHALTNDRDRVHSFLFGTELTNITRHLAHRDPDVALAKIGQVVSDWSGGTRIGDSIKRFNKEWSRRVLGQGAVVLLISDGLDRAGGEGLAQEMERLQISCRHLIWLNPLLRYDGFEPKSQGIQAILPFVDDFRTVHSLTALMDLADALSKDATEQKRRAA